MSTYIDVVIETDRLVMVGISEHYVDEIYAEFTSEITQYMYPAPAKDRSEIVAFVETSRRENMEGKNVQLVVLEKESGEFLGCAGVHHPETRTPELGIWLKKSAHGNAYGMEGIEGLLRWANTSLSFDYLLYPVAADNFASRRIPERLGGVIAREYDERNLSGNMQHVLEYHIFPSVNDVA